MQRGGGVNANVEDIRAERVAAAEAAKAQAGAAAMAERGMVVKEEEVGAKQTTADAAFLKAQADFRGVEIPLRVAQTNAQAALEAIAAEGAVALNQSIADFANELKLAEQEGNIEKAKFLREYVKEGLMKQYDAQLRAGETFAVGEDTTMVGGPKGTVTATPRAIPRRVGGAAAVPSPPSPPAMDLNNSGEIEPEEQELNDIAERLKQYPNMPYTDKEAYKKRMKELRIAVGLDEEKPTAGK